MNSTNISIWEYRREFGTNQSENNEWRSSLERIISSVNIPDSIEKIDLYNISRTEQSFYAGSESRFIIYGFSSFKGAGEADVFRSGMLLNGVHYEQLKEVRGVTEGSDNLVIKSREGVSLAEYSSELNEMVILVDLFSHEPTSDMLAVFEYIMSELSSKVWDLVKSKLSWKYGGDRGYLIGKLEEVFKEQVEIEVNQMKQEIRLIESSQEEYMERLRRNHEKVARLRRRVTQDIEGAVTATEKITSELDLIASHHLIEDLIVDSQVIEVTTGPIYMYNIQNEDKYYLGKMKIRVNLRNSDVRFHNIDNPRRSYWTDQDPHPHVDGENGKPCFGNIASTVAELCSQNEVYALITVLINFLESADTTDVAGANIIRWDMVDEGNNVIVEGSEEDYIECESCEDEYLDRDMYGTAFNHLSDNGPYGEVYICDGCADMYYYYSEVYDELLSENVDDSEYQEED